MGLGALFASLIVPAGTAAGADLLFYSSVPRNLTEVLVKAFEQQNPGVSVRLFQSGAETLIEKLELEIQGRGRPEADVLWIQERAVMERLAERDILENYLPRDHDAIDKRYMDASGRWIGTLVTHVLFMYNSQAFAGQSPPQSWAELADPRYRNKLIFADPRVSGTGSAVASALVQNFGWPYLEKLATNKLRLASGHPAMVSTVIVGERTVGPMLDFSIFEAVAKGQQIGFSFPSEGAVAVPALAAITKETANLGDAKKFVDFLVSQSAADLLRAQGMYHTRKDALPPIGWPELAAIKTIKFDWARYRADKEAVKDRFADLMEN